MLLSLLLLSNLLSLLFLLPALYYHCRCHNHLLPLLLSSIILLPLLSPLTLFIFSQQFTVAGVNGGIRPHVHLHVECVVLGTRPGLVTTRSQQGEERTAKGNRFDGSDAPT